MASFDLEKAGKILGTDGKSGLDAIATGFGAPQCIVNMAESALALLPSDLLGGFSKSLQDGRDAADNHTASLMKSVFRDSGIMEFNTETGKWEFISDSARYGKDEDDAGLFGKLGGTIGAAGMALAYGNQLYNNYNTLVGQVEGLIDCVESFSDTLSASKGAGAMSESLGLGVAGTCTNCTEVEESTCSTFDNNEDACIIAGGTFTPFTPSPECFGAEGSTEDECVSNGGTWLDGGPIEPPAGVGSFGPAGPSPDTQFLIARQQAQASMDFSNKCSNQLTSIANILEARRLNPALEPVFNADIPGVRELLEGTGLPFATSTRWQEIMENPGGDEAVFRLEYGPPKAKKGQFVLTIDGLYYDSQRGGVPDVPVKFIPKENKYLHEYAPNLGGKGVPIGENEINSIMGTIFDPTNISDIQSIQAYYDGDKTLQQLISAKNKHINDLNTSLGNAISDGSGVSIIYNLRQSILSHQQEHDNKINKRKKQIEVAVVTPGTFGLEGEVPSIGAVPINDFSYLNNYNVEVSLDLQKDLILKQGDVSDVVLPIKPKFATTKGPGSRKVEKPLMFPTIGAGGIIFDSSTTGDQKVTLLNLTDEIITDGLISVYNFMEAAAERPSISPYDITSKWGVLNSNASSLQEGLSEDNPIINNNAKLLASSPSSVFVSGLAIPKLTGLVRYDSAGTNTTLGQAVRLPDSQDFRELFYRQEGATIESWVYVPGIETSSTDYSEPDGEWGPGTFNRVLLGCENNGGVDDGIEVSAGKVANTFDSNHVRGFLMGFSRDRQVVNDLSANNEQDYNPLEDRCFFAAPTISYNSSGVSFVNTNEAYCADLSEIYKMKVNMDVSGPHGKTFNDVSGQFMHIVYTVDPSANTMTMYLDGEVMATSSINTAFGTIVDYSFLALPTYYNNSVNNTSLNSFYYNLTSTQNAEFTNGPKLNDMGQFTPWILGGGYTDGLLRWQGESDLVVSNGFMNACHGKISGLNGFVGSTKFYKRALSKKEIAKNYTVQSSFFKNIEI